MFGCALDSWHCVCTLQWATAVGDFVSLCHSLDCVFGGGLSVPVAVFFLPKHCTLWEAMLGDCGMCVRLVRVGVVGFAVVVEVKFVNAG
ncbi:hypothetical protein IG631_00620 [Alternaria alternata]|jgi:hypothetical protein|nr:hypothetical protein IG631_00620 [Alternaria alternata]